MEQLKMQQYRETTTSNYVAIWRNFNSFLLRLDHRPKLWEHRTVTFCTYLIDKGNQSQTVKSYASAIKAMLKTDGYKWKDENLWLGGLTKACKLHNDLIHC